MRREDGVELQNVLEAQCSNPWMDGNALQERYTVTDRNIRGKPAQVRGITRVMASTKDDVLALPVANIKVETLCAV